MEMKGSEMLKKGEDLSFHGTVFLPFLEELSELARGVEHTQT